MLILWAVLFFVLAIVLGFLAFGGVAIAISFFTKLLFLFSLVCFVIAFVLFFVEKMRAKKKHSLASK
jgi:uncharacterized membrane protein YtjA (UPF0391 family)